MAKKYTVMWVCEVLAENPKDAAVIARQSIAHAPYSYFDVYNPTSGELPHQVEVPNDGNYLECSNTSDYYPLAPKNNQQQ